MALSEENQGQLSLRAVNSDFGVLRSAQEQRTWEVIDTLKAIAEDRAVPVSQVALAWVAGRRRSAR